MTAVFVEALSPHTLPITLLLGLIALYWLISWFGILDMEAVDQMLGVEPDASFSDGGGGGKFLHTLYGWLGFLDAPVIFVITIFSLFLWGGSVIGNISYNPEGAETRAVMIFFAAFGVAAVLTRLILIPLRPIAKLLRETENRAPLEGLTGEVRSLTVSDTFGQIEVLRDGGSILLHARVAEGAPELARGTSVLVIMKLDHGDAYLVRPVENAGI